MVYTIYKLFYKMEGSDAVKKQVSLNVNIEPYID
jgi:hypothetical protein